ncbi:MAG: DUF2284 domain-containing protein [bacterium]|nr:DUF2284 domain-containing protein [bacterium]MDT8365761.1 DUF2284 domain-containing protein [bacterium]
MSYPDLEKVFKKNGFDRFKWIKPSDIVVAQWVRMKCMYGCGSYGKKGTCPPNTPSIEECREFFSEYSHGVVFHIRASLEDPATRDVFSREINTRLLKVEREVFLRDFRKAFLLFMDECHLCARCRGTRHDCTNLAMARPCPESMGVDVYETVRKYSLPIQVLKDYDEEMNRYAFLMID